MRTLSSEAAMRALHLSQSSYRPRAIRELKDKIERCTRAAELTANCTGVIDQDRVDYIVGLKLELDRLYADWAEGRIS